MTYYVKESFEESSESLNSELMFSSHKLGDSSCSTASLALNVRLKKLIMTLVHYFRLEQTELVDEIL